MSGSLLRLRLRALEARDRARLAWLQRRFPGLDVHPTASSNLAVARYQLAPGARLRIGRRVATERLPDALRFVLEEGAEVVIGDGTWLRTEVAPVHVVAFAGARIHLGPESFLNGSHLSAKQEVTLGRRAWVGTGSRVFDSDQHDFDAEHPERTQPVRLGDHVWVASDVTVLRGVTIGEHSVIGTRSLVTRDIPPHTLAYGQPAEARGSVGDRSEGR